MDDDDSRGLGKRRVGKSGDASKADVRLAVAKVAVELSNAGQLHDDCVYVELKRRRINFDLIKDDHNLPGWFETQYKGWESYFFEQVVKIDLLMNVDFIESVK